MGWNPFKAVKKAVKSVTKAVKKVAKAVVKVGKKVVSGVKSAVKSVGKSLSKLGPLASIALMAIPGFQAFAAGLAGGLGFTSTMAANIASGALTGFITSGGSLKGAVVGGAMAGAGSFLGDAAKASWNSGSLQTGFATAAQNAAAPSVFTGGATGMAGFQAGMQSAATEWGNFTSKVGDFFSSQTPTGSIADGAAATTSTYNKYGMSPTEYMEVYGKVPDTAIGMDAGTAKMFESGDITAQQAMAKAASGEVTQQAAMLAEQNAAFGAEGADNFFQMMKETTPTELAAGPLTGAPQLVQEQFNASMEAMGIDPNSQQAKMIAEQQFGESMPNMTKDASGQWNYAKYDTTGDLAFTDWQDFTTLVESGQPGLPTPTGTKTPSPSGLLSPTSFTSPSFITQVGAGDLQLSGIKAAGGMGGTLGFTDVQRQTQARLIAQAEAQAEQARKRAMAGWGVA